ncbi:MAG: TetR family transcriptional regulator [Solirubrobacteraceae bacterium]
MIAVASESRSGAAARARRAKGIGSADISGLQRARIVAAAIDIVAERGAVNVSVGDIVARSGVSRRTFYELFADREECLAVALEESLAAAEQTVVCACEPRQRWQERVRAGLIASLSFLDAHPAMARLLLVESPAFDAQAQRRRAETLARLAAVVDEGRELSRGVYEPPRLTAEGAVGAVLSIAQSSVTGPGRSEPLVALAGPLMSMIVLPYLGAAAARRELERPAATAVVDRRVAQPLVDPFKAAGMRLTYRTVRALATVAELGEQGDYPSNRAIGDAAEIRDQGQISKLLNRLARLGLIENAGQSPSKGAPNAWRLTVAGEQMMQSVWAAEHERVSRKGGNPE